MPMVWGIDSVVSASDGVGVIDLKTPPGGGGCCLCGSQLQAYTASLRGVVKKLKPKDLYKTINCIIKQISVFCKYLFFGQLRRRNDQEDTNGI